MNENNLNMKFITQYTTLLKDYLRAQLGCPIYVNVKTEQNKYVLTIFFKRNWFSFDFDNYDVLESYVSGIVRGILMKQLIDNKEAIKNVGKKH